MSRFSAIGFWVSKGMLYEPDFQTYLDSLTTPLSDLQKEYMNDFYVGIKDDFNINLLSEIADQILFLAGETAESSLKNIVKRAHDATAVNSPTWTQYEGFKGDGLSAYIDSGFNGNNGINYTLNNCSFGVYSRTNIDELSTDIGCETSVNNYTHIITKYSNNAIMRVHNGLYPLVNNAVANSLGLYFACRNEATHTGLHGWKNKVLLSISATGDTTSIPDLNFFISARNTATGTTRWSTRQLACEIVGRYYNEAEVGYFTDRFETYMDKRGKGVI